MTQSRGAAPPFCFFRNDKIANRYFWCLEIIPQWEELKVGVEHLMNRLNEGISRKDYMILYSKVYDFCSGNVMQVDRPIDSDALSWRGPDIGGKPLYHCLKDYFEDHLTLIRAGTINLSNESLLRYYSKEWIRYTKGASYLTRLFEYLNRYYVKDEREKGHKDIYNVYTLALVQWRDHFYRFVQEEQSKLTAALVLLIQKDRNHEAVEADLLKKVTDSLVALGLDDDDVNRQNLELYAEAFEKPLLVDTEVYYTAESEEFIGQNSVIEYMCRAEARLTEEENRIDLYLHASSRLVVMTKCEEVLVKNHSGLLQDEFQHLIDQEMVSDLLRMYLLLIRIPNGLDPLIEQFEAHVLRAGLDTIEKNVGASEVVDPKVYVDSILSVHSKCADMVAKAFRNDPGFVAALDKACREFINRNKACPVATKSPELLAKCVDGLLKKSNKGIEDTDLEKVLSDTMIVFKYIEDKDVFQRFYSKLLGKRLIKFSSASEDAEANMISKLKDACGADYTNKLQRMFQDMIICKELNDEFKSNVLTKQEDQDFDIDFHVLVLATAAWPLAAPSTQLKVPAELLKVYERFERYYMNKHSGRKLSWLWQLSRNELRALYTPQKYFFVTSSYQAAVLLQFNSGVDSLSFEELSLGTGLNSDTLKSVVQLLTKQRVLDLKDDKYELNLGFRSKKIRVMLDAPIKAESKAETDDVMKHVDEDRKLLIQAVIVRIMKSRKQMKQQPLIQETVVQLANRFSPKVHDIKKAIESLIEREYIERVEGERDLFSYLA